jgi:hypothetical protein
MSEYIKPRTTADLLEDAWGIIANAYGSNWNKADTEWEEAAKRWRAAYFESLTPIGDK